jgi:hypothetical protein
MSNLDNTTFPCVNRSCGLVDGAFFSSHASSLLRYTGLWVVAYVIYRGDNSWYIVYICSCISIIRIYRDIWSRDRDGRGWKVSYSSHYLVSKYAMSISACRIEQADILEDTTLDLLHVLDVDISPKHHRAQSDRVETSSGDEHEALSIAISMVDGVPCWTPNRVGRLHRKTAINAG